MSGNVGRQSFHPVLRRLFAELEGQGVRWLLLRTPSLPAAPTGDVDLLVACDDADALRDVAASIGFVTLPGRESPPELMLVCYHRESSHWLVLDVATTVTFPSVHLALGPEPTAALLRRRQRRDGFAAPADGDAFWLLLLHCLLDKGHVAEHYRGRLRVLAASAAQSALGGGVCGTAGDRVRPEDLVRAAREERWETLARLGAELSGALRRSTSMRRRLRLLAGDVSTRLRKPLLLRRRRGVSVALLGPNGVGKSTAAAGIQESFPFQSRILYMGIWKVSSRSSGGARKFVEPAVRPLRIWSRYLVAQYHQLRGRLVVFDRYVYEALLPPQPPLAAVKGVYFWLLAHLVPRPSAVIVLDVAGHVAYRRKQENPPDELEFERRVYAELKTHRSAPELIDAGSDADAVRAEISEIIWRELRARWGGSRTGVR